MLAIIVKAIDGVGRNSECQSIDIENAPAGQSIGKKKRSEPGIAPFSSLPFVISAPEKLSPYWLRSDLQVP